MAHPGRSSRPDEARGTGLVDLEELRFLIGAHMVLVHHACQMRNLVEAFESRLPTRTLVDISDHAHFIYFGRIQRLPAAHKSNHVATSRTQISDQMAPDIAIGSRNADPKYLLHRASPSSRHDLDRTNRTGDETTNFVVTHIKLRCHPRIVASLAGVR